MLNWTYIVHLTLYIYLFIIYLLFYFIQLGAFVVALWASGLPSINNETWNLKPDIRSPLNWGRPLE